MCYSSAELKDSLDLTFYLSGIYMIQSVNVAVLIPCFNEEVTIAKTVLDFKKALPEAIVYVYDNNSSDRTAEVARAAGAVVRHEAQQGKGNVVRRMFRDIEADVYIMVDGDDTYDAYLAKDLITELLSGPFDLVNCIRKETEQAAYREGHRLGNLLLTGVVRNIFGSRVKDMLSGYKAFSRRFVKSFPSISSGFDIETELTVHALELSLPISHVEGSYQGRPEGSQSKLRTYRDGWRILMLILKLIRHERPLFFFGVIAVLLIFTALVIIEPVIMTYIDTGLVPRLPTAVLATGIMLLSAMSFVTGLVLDTVTRGRRELRLLTYLQYSAPVQLDHMSSLSSSARD